MQAPLQPKHSLWQRFLAWFGRKLREPEGGCGKCAVCHHVCSLLESGRKEEKKRDSG